MPSATQFLNIDRPFVLKGGGQLPALTLAYETWGTLNADASNAVLILTGLSPSAHAASNAADPSDGWWEPMVGPGKPIDSDRFFVICVNSLGSCWGSTGPASKQPNGEPWRLEFPSLCIEDIAASAQLVVAHLGIEQLAAIVGPSMGGMSSLAWLQQNPVGARHAVLISTAAFAEPFSIAIRSLQREAITNDPAFNDGAYDETNWPATGMRMARKLGMVSYRSATEWRKRFGRETQNRYSERRFGMRFEVESYLEAAARRFTRSFDPCCYLYLSHSMDMFDATGGSGDIAEYLAPVQLESALVVGVESDLLFPVHQQQGLADAMAADGIQTQFESLPSLQGHDAFLVDYARFKPTVAKYLKTIE